MREEAGGADRKTARIGGVKLLILARLDFLQKCVIIKVQFDETEPFRWDAIENEPANLL